MALTDAAIKALKPKDTPYKKADSLGLYLLVTPNGSKLWRLKYRVLGKEKLLSIGAYPATTLLQARNKRDEARRKMAEGLDPSQERKIARIQAITFGALADEWFSYNAPRWAETTARKAQLYLRNDLLPVLGNRPAAEISRPELVELVRKVEARGTLNAAGKIRQWLHQIFRYGLAKGTIDVNPATDLAVVAAPPRKVRHHPHVSFEEIPQLLDALTASRCSPLTVKAVQLLLLTGARPGELRKAPWDEVDFEKALWTIPAERMKARRPHHIPLSRQAADLFASIREVTGSYDLIFAGSANPDRPMSENTINKALRLAGYEGRQTGHGFRHLLSTELNGRGYNRDWIERQLAHGDPDQIRDTYNHALYLKQRQQMMQEWADSIDALCGWVSGPHLKIA